MLEMSWDRVFSIVSSLGRKRVYPPIIPRETMVFSPDSQRFAYAARVKSETVRAAQDGTPAVFDEEWVVILDGQELGRFKDVAANGLTFSPDSQRLAYSVADVIVGARGADPGGNSKAGESYVVFNPFGQPCPWDLDGDGNVFVTDLLLLLMDFGSCNGSPADFDGDGCVTVIDLLTLLGNWGPCPGAPCVWDVNGDGIVDVADLWQVLGNFGPCDGCPEDVNGDGIVNGQDLSAVATHFGPCP